MKKQRAESYELAEFVIRYLFNIGKNVQSGNDEVLVAFYVLKPVNAYKSHTLFEATAEIEKNITPQKYHRLFDALSERQLEIIKDNESKYIVCTAGPGSGKTMVLVHKLASLLLLEDVKHEQLLLLTFSRAAAVEFKATPRKDHLLDFARCCLKKQITNSFIIDKGDFRL